MVEISEKHIDLHREPQTSVVVMIIRIVLIEIDLIVIPIVPIIVAARNKTKIFD